MFGQLACQSTLRDSAFVIDIFYSTYQLVIAVKKKKENKSRKFIQPKIFFFMDLSQCLQGLHELDKQIPILTIEACFKRRKNLNILEFLGRPVMKEESQMKNRVQEVSCSFYCDLWYLLKYKTELYKPLCAFIFLCEC